jgi:hypothetical protein
MGFSPGQVKPKTIKLVFTASPRALKIKTCSRHDKKLKYCSFTSPKTDRLQQVKNYVRKEI